MDTETASWGEIIKALTENMISIILPERSDEFDAGWESYIHVVKNKGAPCNGASQLDHLQPDTGLARIRVDREFLMVVSEIAEVFACMITRLIRENKPLGKERETAELIASCMEELKTPVWLRKRISEHGVALILDISGTDISTLQLVIAFEGERVAVYRGQELKGLPEYPFVMLLGLAARKKRNHPEGGLTSIKVDLKDKTRRYSGFYNLKRALIQSPLAGVVRTSGKRDGTAYLDLTPDMITVRKSIRKFRSVHRLSVRNLLEGWSHSTQTQAHVEEFKRRLGKPWGSMIRNESIVDDAIAILKFDRRKDLALQDLKERGQRALNQTAALLGHLPSQ